KVTSPGIASRMPATPPMTIEPSPTTSPWSSTASSASVRVIIGAASLPRAAGTPGPRVELPDHFRGQVERPIGVDQEPSRGVEYELQPTIRRQLLDHRPDLLDQLARAPLVLLPGPTLRAPGLLDIGR